MIDIQRCRGWDFTYKNYTLHSGGPVPYLPDIRYAPSAGYRVLYWCCIPRMSAILEVYYIRDIGDIRLD